LGTSGRNEVRLGSGDTFFGRSLLASCVSSTGNGVACCDSG
jgi:hypothetical protein